MLLSLFLKLLKVGHEKYFQLVILPAVGDPASAGGLD